MIIERGKAAFIIDGQFGSTGKGLVAAWLAHREYPDMVTTNASANAGHTSIVAGKTSVVFHLPTMPLYIPHAFAYLNAGSIIDPDLLKKEIEDTGFDVRRLLIHPRAAVIEDLDKQYEGLEGSSTTKLASTRKGVGRALARKVMREAKLAGDHPFLSQFCYDMNLNASLMNGDSIVVEVPQGFSLGLNSGLAYPYCTSRDVTVAQAASDAGLHPRMVGNTLMVVRTFPIRVGNIMEGDNLLGTSGPGYPDQKEITWEELGQTPEVTTVTKRVRRVFTWSDIQYSKALIANHPSHVFLNFVNYLSNEFEFTTLVQKMKVMGKAPDFFGIGPNIEDVFESVPETIKAMKERGKW